MPDVFSDIRGCKAKISDNKEHPQRVIEARHPLQIQLWSKPFAEEAVEVYYFVSHKTAKQNLLRPLGYIDWCVMILAEVFISYLAHTIAEVQQFASIRAYPMYGLLHPKTWSVFRRTRVDFQAFLDAVCGSNIFVGQQDAVGLSLWLNPWTMFHFFSYIVWGALSTFHHMSIVRKCWIANI